MFPHSSAKCNQIPVYQNGIRAAAESPYASVGAKLIERGYAALPVVPDHKRPGELHRGTWRAMAEWSTKYRDRLPTGFELQVWETWPDAGVCVVLGKSSSNLVAVDIDTDDSTIQSTISAELPPTTVRKRGEKGETRFFRGAPGQVSKAFNIAGVRVLDLLAEGRQTILPPSRHPSGCTYVWTGQEALQAVEPSELPDLPADIAERLAAALRPFGYEAEPEGAPAADVESDADHPFDALKAKAMANLQAWVPALNLYRCRLVRGGGYEAVATWRPSNGGRSDDVRKLNLKIDTVKGITDFGDGPKGYNCFGLIRAALGVTEGEAFVWLSDRLEPSTFTIDLKPKPLAASPVSEPDDVAQRMADLAQRDGWAADAEGEANAQSSEAESSGAESARPGAESPGAGSAGTSGDSTQRPRRKISPTAYCWTPASAIPPRQWLYGKQMIRKFTSLTVSPGGVGKSSLLLVEAVAMATGRDLLDIGYRPQRRMRVWYWNGEDPKEEIERRLAAIFLHFDIDGQELQSWLFVDSGREMAIKIATEDRTGTKIAMPVVGDLRHGILDNEIDVMIVDPFVSSHSVSENDNNKIDLVAKDGWGAIAEATNSAIELVHHVRKSAHGQFEHTVDDGRGAGALVNAVRQARVLNVMMAEDAARFGVGERRSYFRVDNGKSNMAPIPSSAEWYHLVSIDLCNGTNERPSDNVGVVTRWTPPNAFDDVTNDHLEEVMRRVGEGSYRQSVQAADWVGHVVAEVLGLDSAESAAKEKIKQLLAQWIKSGALKVVSRKDAKGSTRPFVEAGTIFDLKVKPSSL
jgi:hypothetical protein